MAQIGLKELHLAILEKDTPEELSYKAPEKLVAAMMATINPNVGSSELYADDQLYDSVGTLGKIDVEIETADIPLELRAKLQGSKLEDGVLIEKSTDRPPHVALGFKSEKSNGKYRYIWLLKGKAQPMAEDYETKKENVDYRTPRMKFTFMPRIHDSEWKRTGDEDVEGFNSVTWFDSVPSTPQV